MINLSEDTIRELIQKEIGEQIAKHLKTKEVKVMILDSLRIQLGGWTNIGGMSNAVKEIMKEDAVFYDNFRHSVTNKIVEAMICNLQNEEY